MARSKNATKTKDVVETENDSNDGITIDTIKSIFQEIFQQQEKVLIETVNSAPLVTNQRIAKLSSDITISNEKLIKLANDISIDASQEMIEEKSENLKRQLIKTKQQNIGHFEKIEDKNEKLKDKLRDLEDRSRRDNLCFDGIREHENESWNDLEEVSKDFQLENLGLQNIKIERVRRGM